MKNPKLIIFASGSKNGGGSGFENLVKCSQRDELNANIVAVVSNHKQGGVRERADRLGVPFVHFSGPYIAPEYKKIVEDSQAEWTTLSGWLKIVKGLDPTKTFNIHPGPLPQFGGDGMYGHHVHDAVFEAYKKGEVTHSAVSMHFVTDEYDRGPVFFEHSVLILKGDTVETLGKRVNDIEHQWQPHITDMVINGKIVWDGKGVCTQIRPSSGL